MHAEGTVPICISLHAVAVFELNLHLVEAAAAEFTIVKAGQVVDQNLIQNIRFVCGDAVFSLGEVGDSRDHSVRFFPDHNRMTRGGCVSTNALPQIGAVDIYIQTITIYTVNSYKVRVDFYPPVVQIRVAPGPVDRQSDA